MSIDECDAVFDRFRRPSSAWRPCPTTPRRSSSPSSPGTDGPVIADRAEADRRIGVNDLWIAASAAAHHLLVITHDNDFDLVEGVAGLTVVRV